jgi:flavin-dependent dehydrogenase
MSTEQADAVIVGAGLAGSAAARAMARRGRSVVLVEAFQPGTGGAVPTAAPGSSGVPTQIRSTCG